MQTDKYKNSKVGSSVTSNHMMDFLNLDANLNVMTKGFEQFRDNNLY